MRIGFLLIIIAYFSSPASVCQAQHIVYFKCYDCTAFPGGDQAVAISKADDSNGSIVLIRSTYYYPYTIIKVDSMGIDLWNSDYRDNTAPDTIHNINDTIISYRSDFHDIVPAGTGYFVSGSVALDFEVRDSVGNLISNYTKYHPLLTRIATNGTFMWSRVYDFDLSYNSVKILRSQIFGNYLLSFFDIAGNSVFLSTDSSGTFQWAKKLLFTYNNISATNASSNHVITKIDSNGSIVFSFQVSIGNLAEIKFVREVSESQFVFAGDVNLWYPFIAKADTAGNLNWSFSGIVDSTYTKGLLIDQDTDAISFCVERVSGWTTPHPNANERNKTLYTLTLDTSGGISNSVISAISTERYGTYYNPTYSSTYDVQEVELTNAGVLLFVNRTNYDTHYGDFYGANLAQLDSIGNRCAVSTAANYLLSNNPAIMNSSGYSLSYTSSSLFTVTLCNGYLGYPEPEETKAYSFQMFPNPASQNISIEGIFPSHQVIQLFDSFGKKVFEKYITSGVNQLTIDVSHFPSGLYVARATNEENYIVKKILIQH